MSEIVLRPMAAFDLPAVLAVQSQCYGDALLESSEALASRLALSPETCWVAALPDGSLAAYLFTHAWPEDALPPLDGVLARDWSDDKTLTWFVHDMAVAPGGRGTGIAQRLYAASRDAALAAGLRSSRLIAVQSASAWWRRLGYAPIVAGKHMEKLADYGDDAVLMACRL
jgi:GNAT superfamily N-acetyltransferase